MLKHQAFSFARKLLGAMAWASAIGLGLLVYTHFTQKWRDQGYPTIPLEALVAVHNQQGQVPANSRASPYGQGQAPTQGVAGILIDSWDG